MRRCVASPQLGRRVLPQPRFAIRSDPQASEADKPDPAADSFVPNRVSLSAFMPKVRMNGNGLLFCLVILGHPTLDNDKNEEDGFPWVSYTAYIITTISHSRLLLPIHSLSSLLPKTHMPIDFQHFRRRVYQTRPRRPRIPWLLYSRKKMRCSSRLLLSTKHYSSLT